MIRRFCNRCDRGTDGYTWLHLLADDHQGSVVDFCDLCDLCRDDLAVFMERGKTS